MSCPWSLKLNQIANPSPVIARIVANIESAVDFFASITGSDDVCPRLTFSFSGAGSGTSATAWSSGILASFDPRPTEFA